MAKGNNYTVYMHITPSNKRYIGITSRKPSIRWNNGHGYVKNPYFHKAIMKYGWDNIRHEILFVGMTKQEAELKEIELIAVFNTTDNKYGYNMTHGGNCQGTHTDETKKIISKINKGRKASPELKKKLSDTHKGKNCYWFGKERSAETKEKLRQANLGKCQTDELLEKRSKPVIQFTLNGEYIAEYYGARAAQHELGIHNVSISNCCRGKSKSAGGYVWKFA